MARTSLTKLWYSTFFITAQTGSNQNSTEWEAPTGPGKTRNVQVIPNFWIVVYMTETILNKACNVHTSQYFWKTVRKCQINIVKFLCNIHPKKAWLMRKAKHDQNKRAGKGLLEGFFFRRSSIKCLTLVQWEYTWQVLKSLRALGERLIIKLNKEQTCVVFFFKLHYFQWPFRSKLQVCRRVIHNKKQCILLSLYYARTNSSCMNRYRV